MVVTDLPCTLDTGVRQENVRPPSMCTMQAPHCPAPQPYLVPVSLSSSRSTHRRGVPSGAALATGLPLTVKVMAMRTSPDWCSHATSAAPGRAACERSEEHTSELQSRSDLVCRLLLEKKIRNVHHRESFHLRRKRGVAGQ